VLAKWIICRVAEASRPSFSEAQLAWAATADCSGFLGQCGGFHGDSAHVLALWKDREALDRFTHQEHAALADSAQQRGSYGAIQVHVLSRRLDLPGRQAGLQGAVAQAAFIRISDCTVHADKRIHFVDAHVQVWRPGLSTVPGMLGGTLWTFIDRPNRFLVATLWDDERSHSRYVCDLMPDLRASATTNADIAHIETRHFGLARAWTVAAATPVASAGQAAGSRPVHSIAR
jgi:hypothetical protein